MKFARPRRSATFPFLLPVDIGGRINHGEPIEVAREDTDSLLIHRRYDERDFLGEGKTPETFERIGPDRKGRGVGKRYGAREESRRSVTREVRASTDEHSNPRNRLEILTGNPKFANRRGGRRG